MQKQKREAEDKIGSIANSMDMNLSKLREVVKDGGAWYAAVHVVSKSHTQLRD